MAAAMAPGPGGIVYLWDWLPLVWFAVFRLKPIFYLSIVNVLLIKVISLDFETVFIICMGPEPLVINKSLLRGPSDLRPLPLTLSVAIS